MYFTDYESIYTWHINLKESNMSKHKLIKYKCKVCGCEEFISKPLRYDIFEHRDGKLVFIKSETIDEEMELFCRECSEKLLFDDKDITYWAKTKIKPFTLAKFRWG
jgi:hypothetical protein